MKEKFINYFLKSCGQNIAITRFGLEGLYILIEKSVILIIIALVLGITFEVVIFLFFFSIIRLTAFGIHLNSSKRCTFVSIVLFITCAYLSKIGFNIYLCITLYVAAFLSIIINAPAENKRSLNKKNYKIMSIMISIVFGFLIFFFEFYPPLLALFAEGVLITKFVRRSKWVQK